MTMLSTMILAMSMKVTKMIFTFCLKNTKDYFNFLFFCFRLYF